MSNELKPCPFCGGEARLDGDADGWHWIECQHCLASTNRRASCGEDCRPLLVEQWNRRAAQAPKAGEWLPISEAPEGELVVVGWREAEDTEFPDRQAFDYLEDGCWSHHHDHAEHVEMIGGHGVSYTAPYTHFMRLGPLPAAPAAATERGEVMDLPIVEVVEILPTAIWIESDMMGGRSVMLQHQGCEPFEYARFSYDYRYTSNGGTRAAATDLAKQLGAVEPIEHRNRPLPPMPSADEVRQQITDLTAFLADLERPANPSPQTEG